MQKVLNMRYWENISLLYKFWSQKSMHGDVRIVSESSRIVVSVHAE